MNKNAFTLIEMLLVLSVLSILILLAAPLHFSSLTKQKEKQFIEILQYDVLLIQNQANINSKERMYIRFYNDHYLVIHGRNPDYAKRNYPDGWTLVSPNRILEFNTNGTVHNPGTIVMHSKNERIAFVFPLGKGRFYFDKEKRVFND